MARAGNNYPRRILRYPALYMTDHVCIRRPEYVSGTRERPEVKVFSQTHQGRHPVPWGKVAIGDSVWMKWSGGPIVAKSKVNGLRQIEDCTPDQLRTAVGGSLLASRHPYFDSLPPRFDAVVVHLENEQWLDDPLVPRLRSRGESWIVLDTDAQREGWLTPGATRTEPSVTASRNGSGHVSRTLSHALRFQVLRRDGFACTYCGRQAPEVKLHIDHLVPWSRGGSNSLDNLRTACAACNLGKGAGPAVA